MCFHPFEKFHFGGDLFVIVSRPGRFGDPSFEHLDICKDQLKIDRLDIPERIDAAVHMDDIAVVKAADHMDDGVHLADIGEELIAQSFSFGRAFDKTGDIHEFNDSRHDLCGIIHIRQYLQTGIRDRNDPHIRVYGYRTDSWRIPPLPLSEN